MAKNLNSVSFTFLLLVLVLASTGILKSKAAPCGANPCSTSDAKVFLSECGPSPYTGTNADCCTCCKNLGLASPPLCWAVVEGTSPPHCHCYQKV